MVLYWITSISSASTDRYPGNTNVKFAHHLPESLPLHPDKRYVISLLSLCVPTKLKNGTKKPSYVNLLLHQLSSKNFSSAGGDHRSLPCLARLILPEEGVGGTGSHWLVLDNPNPLILDESLDAVQELSFELTDEHNNVLQLADSDRYTLVSCAVEEMDRADRFTLTLNKSLSKHLYPDNSDVRFYVDFGHTAVSEDDSIRDWEVALHSIIVPSQICLAGQHFECSVTNTGGVKIMERIKNVGQTAETVFKEMKESLRPLGVYLTRVGRRGEQKIKIRFVGEAASVHFDTLLCQLLNIAESDGSGLGHTVRQAADSPVTPNNIIGAFSAELSLPRPQHIVIYSDMVQSSVVGNIRAPLIDIISSSELGLLSTEKETLYNVLHPVFRPVHKPNMKEASITLGDVFGKPIKLENKSDVNIQFMFVFRK